MERDFSVYTLNVHFMFTYLCIIYSACKCSDGSSNYIQHSEGGLLAFNEL